MAQEKNLEISSKNLIYLMLSQPERIQAMNTAVIKKMLGNGCTPLIITVNKPYKVLARIYAKEGINPEQYYVIDTVTQYSGGAGVSDLRVKYISNPANLTELGIVITKFLQQIPDARKCIMFDSVSMLLIYIPTATASKFFHFVVNKLKLSDISGIFLCVDKGLDPFILSQMSTFVDKIVDFDELDTL